MIKATLLDAVPIRRKTCTPCLSKGRTRNAARECTRTRSAPSSEPRPGACPGSTSSCWAWERTATRHPSSPEARPRREDAPGPCLSRKARKDRPHHPDPARDQQRREVIFLVTGKDEGQDNEARHRGGGRPAARRAGPAERRTPLLPPGRRCGLTARARLSGSRASSPFIRDLSQVGSWF